MVSNPTHSVIITISSSEQEDNVNVKVEWSPSLADADIEKQGYVPAAYLFADGLISSLETAIETAHLLEFDVEDMNDGRTIN